jgi:homoserine O-succinyltransferase
MVVNIDASRFGDERVTANTQQARRAAEERHTDRAERCITIGLLNNMAGAAFKATERQFITLLDSASEGIPVHVSFYALPGLSSSEAGGQHFARHYQNVESLLDTRLDGLIVTGREPRMASLCDEPYWKEFTQVLEWARNNTHSTVWSCLAAHAAILHMDDICRRKGDEKHFGVFNCVKESEHALTQGLSRRFMVPHSRWNGVAAQDLTDCGYSVLSRIAGDGVDMFIKQEKSLFVFFQGHLEYESDTLMREYRRDVTRYFRGEAAAYPLLPRGYFDEVTEGALTELSQRAMSCHNTEVVNDVAAAMVKSTIANSWHTPATTIYRSWLECICVRKGIRYQAPVPAFAAS